MFLAARLWRSVIRLGGYDRVHMLFALFCLLSFVYMLEDNSLFLFASPGTVASGLVGIFLPCALLCMADSCSGFLVWKFEWWNSFSGSSGKWKLVVTPLSVYIYLWVSVNLEIWIGPPNCKKLSIDPLQLQNFHCHLPNKILFQLRF